MEKHNCHNCKHMASIEVDVVCHMFCVEKNRDFTLGGENTEACELFEED